MLHSSRDPPVYMLFMGTCPAYIIFSDFTKKDLPSWLVLELETALLSSIAHIFGSFNIPTNVNDSFINSHHSLQQLPFYIFTFFQLRLFQHLIFICCQILIGRLMLFLAAAFCFLRR